MAGWAPIAAVKLKCPFCGKEGVTAKYIPPSLGVKTSSSSSAGTKTKIYKTLERYEGISGCEFCGKTDKEIQKALRDGVYSKEKENKIVERLKKQGLFLDEIKTKL